MKKIYIVHCWDGKCEDGWYPWISKNLRCDDVEVICFDMPNTNKPVIEEWVGTLASHVDVLDSDTYFIGHSIGCQTIMRFLESKEITNIGGILFVAPWLELLPEAISDKESEETARPWLNTPIDFTKIKKFTSNITCLFSDNDYFVDIKQADVFKEVLGAKTHVVKNCGHISQEDNIYELDEILTLGKEMIGEDHE